jgi:hypothetical protein
MKGTSVVNDDTISDDATEVAMGGDATSDLVGQLERAGAVVVIEEDEE